MLEFYQFCRTRAAVASFIIVLEVNLAVIHFRKLRISRSLCLGVSNLLSQNRSGHKKLVKA